MFQGKWLFQPMRLANDFLIVSGVVPVLMPFLLCCCYCHGQQSFHDPFGATLFLVIWLELPLHAYQVFLWYDINGSDKRKRSLTLFRCKVL